MESLWDMNWQCSRVYNVQFRGRLTRSSTIITRQVTNFRMFPPSASHAQFSYPSFQSFRLRPQRQQIHYFKLLNCRRGLDTYSKCWTSSCFHIVFLWTKQINRHSGAALFFLSLPIAIYPSNNISYLWVAGHEMTCSNEKPRCDFISDNPNLMIT